MFLKLISKKNSDIHIKKLSSFIENNRKKIINIVKLRSKQKCPGNQATSLS